jgi:hypothetical protein
MSPEYSAKPSKPLLLGYKAASPQSTIKPVQTDSLLKFVKKHPAKINENELNKRMKRLQEEMQERKNSRIKGVEEKGVEQIKQEVQNLSAEMKKLDNIMDENVANNVIIEKQEDIAEKIDQLENNVNKYLRSPSLSNSSVSSSALFESLPSSVSSNTSYTTPQSSPDINWSPPTPKFNERFTRKNRGPPPKLKKHLKLKPRNPKFNKKTQRNSLLDEDNSPGSPEPTPSPKYDFWGNPISPSPESPSPSYESWRDDENKVKGPKRNSDTPTPSPSWDVEFGNKGLPQASEKHKGNSPGWSNSPVSPKKNPKQERWWWDNQNTPSPELEESASSTPEEESPDASPPKNHKKGWLWGGM